MLNLKQRRAANTNLLLGFNLVRPGMEPKMYRLSNRRAFHMAIVRSPIAYPTQLILCELRSFSYSHVNAFLKFLRLIVPVFLRSLLIGTNPLCVEVGGGVVFLDFFPFNFDTRRLFCFQF